ncbi:MAG: DUF86 domain-containing protein [Dehalococcoidia bacterium]|nr:DUF86 domain-containing protein [Dehalococcoidia bacterium]
MSSKRRKWKFRLRHIIEAIGRISSYIWGMNFEQFKADPKTVDAVIRNFLIIGEAARHIPPEVERDHTQAPWGRMRAMRNILVHEYESIDLKIVWDTAKSDLPLVVPLLQAVLESKDYPED